MDSNYHLKLQLSQELREAVIVKRINEELLEQLSSSLEWLIHYSKKNKVALPEADKIISLIEKAQYLIGQIYPSPDFEQSNHHPKDEQNPLMTVLRVRWEMNQTNCM